MTYVTVFGGQNVNPAMLSYAGYTITATLNLVWPFEAVDGDLVAAAKLDITSNGAAVVLPPANQVSVGQDVLIKNVGVTTFEVFANDGTASLGTIASGEAWYFYLTDNSDAVGVWDSVQFGAGTSNANAAALAGKGLVANVTKLDQNLLTDNETTGLTIDLTRKARVVQNEGGTVVWAFDPAATLGDGFFFYAINAGTGTVTLAPDGSELIDGELTKLLQPDENCIVFCDGTSFHTLGYGRVLISEITGDSINVSGTGDYELSDTERDAQVQDFTGTLTGARTVTYGNVVGYWFVYNNTSGAFTLTARCDSLDPGALIPQGYMSIIRSNGTNMDIAFTDLGGTVTGVSQVAGETVATPNPIVVTGTIGLADTAVTPGTYGTAARTATVTVDQKGRATAASDQLISIPLTQVQAFSSAVLRGQLTDETGTGFAVFSAGPTITGASLITPTCTDPVVGTQAPGDNSTLAASTAFVTAAFAGKGTFRTGDVKLTLDNAEESGVNVMLNGETIGSAASAATGRAAADTEDLFVFLWDRYSDSLCPVSGGRGASGAADFAANKTLQLPDARGRLLVGWDTMGSSSANRITSGSGGVDGATLGASGGIEAKTFTYNGTTDDNSGNILTGSGGQTTAPDPHTHTYSGSTDSASILNPMIVINILVYL